MIKKKIIIFTSAGGNGHMSVTRALLKELEPDYTVDYVITFTQVLENIDCIQTITHKRWCMEDLYNYCLQKKWIRTINNMYSVGRIYFWLRRKKIGTLIKKYLEEHKPDLIISVTPLINGILARQAEELGIPFLLIPTDLDATTFMYGIHKNVYEKFKVALAFEDHDILRTLPEHVTRKYIEITGFPLRADFFSTKDIQTLKTEHSLDPEKYCVLIVMGGQGSESIMTYIQALSMMPMPLHLIICLGNYTALKCAIENMQLPAHITTTIVSFTHSISDFMAMADVIITKSGSVSFCEALCMEKPILLDATSSVLVWEKFNHAFVKKYNKGTVIRQITELAPIIEELWLKKNSTSHGKILNYQDGCKNIKNVIERMA